MTTRIDSPLTLPSGLQLPNRVVKAAMTEALADDEGRPSKRLHTLYERWSQSGAGLLITGNVGLDREHPVRPRDVVLEEGVDLAPFETWARISKAGGAKVVMQLNHAGRQTSKAVNPQPLGPSATGAVKLLGQFGAPRAATEDDLEKIIRDTGAAAKLAQRSGFDGVQIHAAHGYLLNQFLSPDVNRREDRWGGSLENRARLLLECVRAARRETTTGFSVLVKLNSGDFLKGGFAEDDALAVVRLLAAEGIDALEISGGRYESAASFGYASDSREAYFLDFARRAKALIDVPLLLTGGVRSRAVIDAALNEGALDLIGLARPMIEVPHYPRLLLENAELPTIAPPRLRWRRYESAAEIAWYYAQLQRMGDGLEPNPSLSPLWSLLSYVFGDAREARKNRKRQHG